MAPSEDAWLLHPRGISVIKPSTMRGASQLKVKTRCLGVDSCKGPRWFSTKRLVNFLETEKEELNKKIRQYWGWDSTVVSFSDHR